MENKRGKWQMKCQLSNKGKRKAGRAADGNAAPGEEEGPIQGWSGKEGAAHDAQRRAGPAGAWRRGSTLMLQWAFCGGAGWGWDPCHGCPQVTGGTRVKSCCAQEIPAKTPLLHWFHTVGIWVTKLERSWGRLDVFHDRLWVPDLQETHERQDSGWERRCSLRHNQVPHWAREPHPSAATGCRCHLPSTPDSWGVVRPPGADLEKGNKQGSAVLPMGLTKFGPQLRALKQHWVSQGERRQQGSIPRGQSAPASAQPSAWRGTATPGICCPPLSLFPWSRAEKQNAFC